MWYSCGYSRRMPAHGSGGRQESPAYAGNASQFGPRAVQGPLDRAGLFVPNPNARGGLPPHFLCLTCLVLSVEVRWRPLVSVAVVTHLVSHPPRGALAVGSEPRTSATDRLWRCLMSCGGSCPIHVPSHLMYSQARHLCRIPAAARHCFSVSPRGAASATRSAPRPSPSIPMIIQAP